MILSVIRQRVGGDLFSITVTEPYSSDYDECLDRAADEKAENARPQLVNHIDNMDELKNGIGLRAYGQKDPVVQYRFEGGEMFDEMISQIKLEVAKIMLHVVKASGGTMKRESTANITNASLDNSAISSMNIEGETAPKTNQTEKAQPIVNDGPKVGRNDPCPCGSGKKYKNCCGKNQ